MPIVAGYVAEATSLTMVMMIASGAALIAAVLSCFYRETAPSRVNRAKAQREETVGLANAVEAPLSN